MTALASNESESELDEELDLCLVSLEPAKRDPPLDPLPTDGPRDGTCFLFLLAIVFAFLIVELIEAERLRETSEESSTDNVLSFFFFFLFFLLLFDD